MAYHVYLSNGKFLMSTHSILLHFELLNSKFHDLLVYASKDGRVKWLSYLIVVFRGRLEVASIKLKIRILS